MYWIKFGASPAVQVYCTSNLEWERMACAMHDMLAIGDMKNGGGGWTLVARGSDITDGAVGTVQSDWNVKGIWHFSTDDIAGKCPSPSVCMIYLPFLYVTCCTLQYSHNRSAALRELRGCRSQQRGHSRRRNARCGRVCGSSRPVY